MTTAAAPRPHSHHAEKLALKDRAAPGRLAPVAARHGVEMPAVVSWDPEADPGAVLAALAPILGAGGGSTRAHRETIGVSDRTSIDAGRGESRYLAGTVASPTPERTVCRRSQRFH